MHFNFIKCVLYNIIRNKISNVPTTLFIPARVVYLIRQAP